MFKAHRLLHHSPLGLRLIKEKKRHYEMANALEPMSLAAVACPRNDRGEENVSKKGIWARRQGWEARTCQMPMQTSPLQRCRGTLLIKNTPAP